jgi:hypothetical protein
MSPSLLLYFCIFLVYLASIKCEGCKIGLKAQNSTFCNKFNDNAIFCCFLTSTTNKTDNICYPIQIVDYKGETTINYFQKSYQAYCGLGAVHDTLYPNLPNETLVCSERFPASAGVCTKQSTSTNTCCHYENDGITGCYWLGTKYYGKAVNGNLIITCQSCHLKLNFLIVMLIFLFI